LDEEKLSYIFELAKIFQRYHYMEKYFKKTIEIAKKSVQEEGKVNPYVGALILDKNGKCLGHAFRGEIKHGEHGEFTLLERKLKNKSLAGGILFVTLEPCTKRGENKIPCAERIIERKIKKVFIGMLDPNPKILGKGVRKLQSAGIDVQMYPFDYAIQVEELNRDFIREQKKHEFTTTQKVNEFHPNAIFEILKMEFSIDYSNLKRPSYTKKALLKVTTPILRSYTQSFIWTGEDYSVHCLNKNFQIIKLPKDTIHDMYEVIFDTPKFKGEIINIELQFDLKNNLLKAEPFLFTTISKKTKKIKLIATLLEIEDNRVIQIERLASRSDSIIEQSIVCTSNNIIEWEVHNPTISHCYELRWRFK
jgi:pyrimidine deaminase RibD-like protein